MLHIPKSAARRNPSGPTFKCLAIWIQFLTWTQDAHCWKHRDAQPLKPAVLPVLHQTIWTSPILLARPAQSTEPLQPIWAFKTPVANALVTIKFKDTDSTNDSCHVPMEWNHLKLRYNQNTHGMNKPLQDPWGKHQIPISHGMAAAGRVSEAAGPLNTEVINTTCYHLVQLDASNGPYCLHRCLPFSFPMHLAFLLHRTDETDILLRSFFCKS